MAIAKGITKTVTTLTEVVLTLSVQEAKVLYKVVQLISGPPEGNRGAMDRIDAALSKIDDIDSSFGQITASGNINLP